MFRSCPGGEGKHRTTTQLIMHISSAEIAELADGDECGRGMAPDMLIKRGVVIIPGENKIVVSGKVGGATVHIINVPLVSDTLSLLYERL